MYITKVKKTYNFLNLKKVIVSILSLATTVFTIMGIFWILGVEGASQTKNMAIYQIIIRVMQGGFLCGVAWVLNFIKLVIE